MSDGLPRSLCREGRGEQWLPFHDVPRDEFADPLDIAFEPALNHLVVLGDRVDPALPSLLRVDTIQAHVVTLRHDEAREARAVGARDESLVETAVSPDVRVLTARLNLAQHNSKNRLT
jgi:hypothetical protein